MRASLIVLVLALPASASAQAPPDGLYEDFASIFMQPSVPLTSTPTALPRWVDVRTTGSITTVTFEPEARVVWRITWGAHGPDEKVTLVDGAEWTRSAYTYDAGGHLASKHVTGSGVEGGVTYAYTTDASGEIRTRTATLSATMSDGSVRTTAEAVEVVRSRVGVVVTLRRAGIRVRRDRYDAQQRLIETRLYDEHGREAGRLTYVRDASGAVTSVERRVGSHRGVADLAHPDLTLTQPEVAAIASTAVIEEHEVRLLLGAADSTESRWSGAMRRITSDYSPNACWMNQVSGFVFDATGLLTSGWSGCICGYCVDASAAIDSDDAARAIATQRHFALGPWVRLDGALDVTAEHEVMTPDGPRAVGTLHAGDVVLTADGLQHVLASVDPLPESGPRLGVNLETSDGLFRAGGLLFRSEAPRACAP
jgi:YD repeat-containing protein